MRCAVVGEVSDRVLNKKIGSARYLKAYVHHHQEPIASVPKTMHGDGAGETGTFQNRLEAVGGEVLGVHSLADLVREDQPVILVG